MGNPAVFLDMKFRKWSFCDDDRIFYFCWEEFFTCARRMAGFFFSQNLSRNDTADSDLPPASLFTILPPLTNEFQGAESLR